jgi:tetratricopeptide (TPR) repeat protein
MEIQLSIKSPVSDADIYELRNFLLKEIDHLDVTIKEQPAPEGEMAIGIIEPLLIGVLTSLTNYSVQDFYNLVIKPKLTQWLKRKTDETGRQPEVIASVKNETSTVLFLQNREGETVTLTDFTYSIDKSQTRVVLIGTSEYGEDFPPILPIKGNLEDLYTAFTDAACVGVPAENVTTLFNKASDEIEATLLQLARLPNVQTLILYFAGHGYRSDVKSLYLIAKNTKKIDDYIVGGVNFDFVNNNILARSKAKQKIVILDACHSGVAAQGSNDLIENLDVKGTYILASSSSEEKSYFNNNSCNTYFTAGLLNILKDGVDDSAEMLALEDVYKSVKQNQQAQHLSLPIYRNSLNIPADSFYIARNPRFSIQKQKQKAADLFENGLFEDALLNYRLLINKYPDETLLRKQYLTCQTEILFQEFSFDGDMLFATGQYSAAAEKYQRAMRVKKDPGAAYKLHCCLTKSQLEKVSSAPPVSNPIESNHAMEPAPAATDPPPQPTSTYASKKMGSIAFSREPAADADIHTFGTSTTQDGKQEEPFGHAYPLSQRNAMIVLLNAIILSLWLFTKYVNLDEILVPYMLRYGYMRFFNLLIPMTSAVTIILLFTKYADNKRLIRVFLTLPSALLLIVFFLIAEYYLNVLSENTSDLITENLGNSFWISTLCSLVLLGIGWKPAKRKAASDKER